ncbi:MAG: ABC transporter ATP-binding protein [Gammaproteobacteria bacterium]|nr:ABC transporter ATP-binding protein [Gammaproteobacteria bacterium]
MCRNLSKTYSTLEGQEVVAIKSVDLTVEPGEFLSIVGPSGCGKSTLLKLLAGLIASTSGEAHLFGDLIVGPRKDIGMVFQSPTLLEWRTVLSNTMLPIEVLGLDRAAGRQRALTLLGMTGLGGFEAKYPGELSGGMQQRVSLSRALVHDPALLLMDEPFGALDALTRETMGLELQKIWQESGKTVVLITHSISEAVFLGDRVSVMSPRPGQLLDFLKIDLPRPRSLDMMGTEAFGKSLNEVRKIMDRDSSS